TLGKTGIFYKGTLGTEDQNVGVNINASALDKGTAIYAENMNVTSSGTLNIGKEGVGIFVKGNSSQTGKNTGSIDLTSGKMGAVGMYTKTANLINESISATTGIISVNDASQIGMYAEGINVKAINKGTINLNVDGATGIYVKSGATAELGTGNNIVFGGKSSVGVFAENAKVNFENNLTFTNDNVNKNIYVYGKNSSVGIDAGSLVKVDGINIPTAAGTEGNKTVGIYLENAGTGSTFNGTGNLEVLNGAVGIYSKGNNTLDVNVAVAGDKTTGIFIDGASTISGTVTAKGTSSAGAVGVYGSGGIVTVGAGGLVLNTDAGRGTGMYLTDGASTTGGSITVNNTAAGTKNIGVYYSKGATSGTVTNSSAISLIGSESIGIYAADGITLVNNANITSTAGKTEDIGSYVGGGSQLTSTGTITMNDNDSIGIYTEEGKGINSGNILMNGSPSAPTKSVVGMVAEAKAGKTAAVENAAGGTITAGANLGMYIGGTGTSSGKNAGTITTTTGTGVYVDGSTNSFDGT
ncbi:beta strand repeat-containing protein, partial [Fusobacterium varium]|uniref:beta strand repeat-containing protein n=1 Tax=Fusobacterium varium TaxID=856 RepID=UPI00399C72FC|nr:autotransporter-associated N-terminal domain-containing protein [Fusobacterium varium]